MDALNFHAKIAKIHNVGCDHFTSISNTVIYKKLRSRDPEYPYSFEVTLMIFDPVANRIS